MPVCMSYLRAIEQEYPPIAMILPQLLIVAAIILPMEVSFSKSLTLIMTSSILHDILSIIRSIRDTLLSHFINPGYMKFYLNLNTFDQKGGTKIDKALSQSG